ncbi:MAG: aminoglycoside N(3)-acetyltransferase [Anaerolineaceae bacterium]|nr:aminoglycoside N(3)-acetyltransferase [Anaerolineaceae bacterium]
MGNITQAEIVQGLVAGGLPVGSQVLVHSSLSSFGHVEGGADAIIDALLEAVGVGGTVLVPTLTGNEALSPENPPVFDPLNSACWTGTIPESFRKRSNAIRSLHPTHSVAAIGADAQALIKDHWYSITPCDAHSPYGKLARRPDGYILLIGVDYESCTMFHHVEELVGVEYHMQPGFAKAKIIIDGQAIERHYMLHRYRQTRNFNIMESVFIERSIQTSFTIGNATLRMIQASKMVELTAQSLTADPHILCE